MSLLLFWVALGLLVYMFVLFPLLIFIRGFLIRRPYKTGDFLPMVSMVVAAYNEADSIEGKIKNFLSLDYPKELAEMVIASDGSTDGTDEIVLRYVGQGIRLLSLPRQGKYATLNSAVPLARGEIIVFSDANSMFASDALRKILRPFADQKVGGVAGNQTYFPENSKGSSGVGERLYWSFDQTLKQFQSRAGNVTSSTGSIYAIRKSLYQPVPSGAIDDFVISTGVIAQGFRLVYCPDAVSFEPVAGTSDLEFARKVRNIMMGLSGVMFRRNLMNPLRYGFYAVQLFSHKFLRRLMFIPLIMLMFVSASLWNQGIFYKVAFLAQVCFYGFAFIGYLLEGRRAGLLKLFSIPFYFCMVYLASMLATLNLLRGHRVRLWDTQRQESAGAGNM